MLTLSPAARDVKPSLWIATIRITAAPGLRRRRRANVGADLDDSQPPRYGDHAARWVDPLRQLDGAVPCDVSTWTDSKVGASTGCVTRSTPKAGIYSSKSDAAPARWRSSPADERCRLGRQATRRRSRRLAPVEATRR